MENLNYFTQPIISPLSRMGSFYDPYSMDAIINSSVQNRASMLQPKLRELYRQREAEKQKKELADDEQKQQQIGAAMKGLQQGAEIFSKPTAKDNPEIGGQNVGEKAAATAGRQEATVEAGKEASEASRSYETAMNKMESAVEDQNIDAYKEAVGILPGLAQNAMSAYDIYNKIESGTATPEDYASLTSKTMGTSGQMMKAIGEQGGSLYNAGGTLGGLAGTLGGGLGAYKGIQGILNNPNDPSNYINTAIGGAQAYEGANALLSPVQATASGAPSGISQIGSSPFMSALQGIAGGYNISQGSKSPVDYMAAGGAALQAAGAGLSSIGATGIGTAASSAGSGLASATPWGAIGAAAHGLGEHLEKHNPKDSFVGRLGRGISGGTGDFLSTHDKTAGAISAWGGDPTHSVHKALDLGLEQGDYIGALKAFAIEPFEDLFGW
jgi:hypothetical protein